MNLRELVQHMDELKSPIVGVVAGSGQIVRSAISGGTDIIIALNAGLFRNLGMGSLAAFLPFGNANDQTLELLTKHILPRSGATPIVAGVLAHDPMKPLENRLSFLKRLGVQGVTNWPAVGFWDGVIRSRLEEEGLGVQAEIAMLARVRSLDLVSFGFALSAEDAFLFAESGVDGLILNVGLTHDVQDVIEKANQVQMEIATIRQMMAAVRRSGKRPLCLFFGGTVTEPQDFHEILRNVDLHGYAGGSSFERIPVSKTVEAKVRLFKSVRFPRDEHLPAHGSLIGQSPRMKRLFTRVDQIAMHDVNVCILGESGTGKELVAREIHRLSDRRDHPFVTMNCGAIPESLVESEFFGFEKGAFTGADQRRLGKFELANLGTLLLDEVADLSPHAQVALLRVIQQGEIARIGGQKIISVDVRILSASNRSLRRMVRKGSFREDLYYRLNTFELFVPPLRERLGDLPFLVDHLVHQLSAKLDRQIVGIAPDFLDRLCNHGWPGNVRELEHVLTRCALLEEDPVLKGTSFKPVRPATPARASRAVASADTRVIPLRNGRQQALDAISRSNGNKSKASAMLGISRKTLYCWLRKASPPPPESSH